MPLTRVFPASSRNAASDTAAAMSPRPQSTAVPAPPGNSSDEPAKRNQTPLPANARTARDETSPASASNGAATHSRTELMTPSAITPATTRAAERGDGAASNVSMRNSMRSSSASDCGSPSAAAMSASGAVRGGAFVEMCRVVSDDFVDGARRRAAQPRPQGGQEFRSAAHFRPPTIPFTARVNACHAVRSRTSSARPVRVMR